MRKAIVTGATGPLGIELCKYLINSDILPIAIVRSSSRRKYLIPSGVKIIEGDLSYIVTLKLSADMFFHLGWSTETRETVADPIFQAKNIVYTVDAVRLAHFSGCKVFVGAGSWVEHGNIDKLISSDLPADPQSAYGVAKYAAGKLSRILCQSYGIRHCWARILSIYGPYDKETTAFVSVIQSLLKGERPLLTKGEQTWDFIYSADCAKAIYLIAEKGKDGAVYPVGTGFAPPIRERFEYIKNQISPKTNLVFGERPYAPNQAMLLCADITKLKEDTGFEPNFTFEEGIEKTIEYERIKNGIHNNSGV